MLTGRMLAEYCLRVYAAKWVYWYGTYGKKCSKKLYDSKRKQYPSHYGDGRTAGYMKDIAEGRTCADCVGMIKSFFWKNGDVDAEPKYRTNGCPDVSANGMFKLCAQTGPIATIPDEPGLVVWKDGHIGVYVGDGYTVEMKGFNYDCRKKKVADGPWKKWGRLPASMLACAQGGGGTTSASPSGEPSAKDEGNDRERIERPGEGGPKGAVVTERMVEIVGGDCYVRTAPNTSGRKLGVAHRGERLPYGGETSPEGWKLVKHGGKDGWVSGKYSRLAV